MDINTKCRTCLSSTNQLSSCFTNEIINNQSIMYSQMIFECTNVQVSNKQSLVKNPIKSY